MPRSRLVHVAIPIRDVEPWLDRALESLVAQTMPRWTATVVDDGSLDGSLEIARSWARRDDRFEVVERPRLGVVPALEVAVVTEAPFLARFDGDDICHPDRFALQVAFLEAHADVDVVDSRADCFNDEGAVPEGMLRYQAWHDRITEHADFEREWLVDSPVCNPAAMARTAAMLPYRDGDLPEDYELWLRLSRAGSRFHKLPERLVRWRDRPSRATRTDPRYRRRALMKVKWEHFVATRPVDALRIAVWGAHTHGRPWIKELVAIGCPPVTVVDVDPKIIGRTRHGVPIVDPERLPSFAPDLVLVAVGVAGARSLIEARLDSMGLTGLAVAGLA